MVGLEMVKEAIGAFARRAQLNYHRELQGKEPITMGLNRVFLGSPGTGKTTEAKLYGQLLVDLGLLRSSDIIVKSPPDFIGEYIGKSEAQTKRILTSARGEVLIIDEAYMLYPGKRGGFGNTSDIYKTAVIDTLVSEIQNTGDNCVILIEYTQAMRELLQHANPGLSRRFPIEDAFIFHDYSIDQLTQMPDQKARDEGLDMTAIARSIAIEMITLARDRPNFGNGGEVENILSRAKLSQQKRQGYNLQIDLSQAIVLEPEDFDADFKRMTSAGRSCREIFRDVVGCEEIIAQFEGYQRTVRGMRLRGINPRPHIPFTFVFKGPPGTGKTTTARKLGHIFYDMGLLSTPEVIECSVTDMIGEYLGKTGPKVINLFEQALGKVLFIDEAYRLGKVGTGDAYTSEATGELVDCITKQRYMNKLVIILAGYEEDMNKLMRVNRGIASRFPTSIVFPHMPPQHCLVMLRQRVEEYQICLPGLDGKYASDRGKILLILKLFSELSKTASWGNGRDVETLAKDVIRYVFSRPDIGTGELSMPFQDLQHMMKNMLEIKMKDVAASRPGFNLPNRFRPKVAAEAAKPSWMDESGVPLLQNDPADSNFEVDYGEHKI